MSFIKYSFVGVGKTPFKVVQGFTYILQKTLTGCYVKMNMFGTGVVVW